MSNTGPAPFKVIKANAGDTSQRSSFWIVAIVSFEEPAAMYSKGKTLDPVATKELIIIENDVIAVTLNETKDSFGKMCSLTLKSTDLYYPQAVHNGDWVFVWMFDTQNKADECVKNLQSIKAGGSAGTTLCDQDSGLKHVGRIVNVNTDDRMSNGVRSITQSISTQMFLEFATSVYYTFDAVSAVLPENTPSGSGLLGEQQRGILNFQTQGLQRALTGLSEKFTSFYENATGLKDFTPDNIIALFFILIMGIDSDETNKVGMNGTLNDGIAIPKLVAEIMSTSAKQLWEMYQLNLGVQKYSIKKGDWYESFMPDFETVSESLSRKNILKKSPTRCKGFVPFVPTMWSNQSMWSILEQYVNPVCDEMYTSLRMNENGSLRPTLTVREKPFTTGLLKSFGADGKPDPSIEAKQESQQAVQKKQNQLAAVTNNQAESASTESDLKQGIVFGSAFGNIAELAGNIGVNVDEVTHFATLPRWVIDPSVVRDFSWGTDESRRVNFVQVFGRNSSPELLSSEIDQASLRQSQVVAGNYVADEADIARNGLRAQVIESQFDLLSGATESGSLAPLWARLNADWSFNGHLKAFGSITVNGIWEPIQLGDNLQYQGILFHIEGISHNAGITNGEKSWTTTITLSNGMLASSMASTKSLPTYPAHAQVTRSRANVPGPGYTVGVNRISAGKSLNPLKQLKGLIDEF